MSLTASVALAASPTGTVTETINVGVRSLTVSPTAVNVCSQTSPMTFPNGSCTSPGITISNGPAGGYIFVNGASAFPSDGSGNGWALCTLGLGGPTCAGGSVPGTDQYMEVTANGANYGTQVTNAAQCDAAFDLPSKTYCSSGPGEAATESLLLEGPANSTDQSPTFTTSVTWTAAP